MSDEDEFQACWERGLAHRDAGELDDARREFRAALDLEPASGEMAYECGYVEQLAMRPVDAINMFNRAIAMGFTEPIVHYNRACMAAVSGNRDVLLESLKLAVVDDQNRVDAIADPDFQRVLDLPEVRTLLKLPALDVPPWVRELPPARIVGFRTLNPGELSSVASTDLPRHRRHYECLAELWELAVPSLARRRRAIFDAGPVWIPQLSRDARLVAWVDHCDIVILDLDSEAPAQRITLGAPDTLDVQLRGWSDNDELLASVRESSAKLAGYVTVAHHDGAWSATALAPELRDAINAQHFEHAGWGCGSGVLVCEPDAQGKLGTLVELSLDGRRSEVCTVPIDEWQILHPVARSERYAFNASGRIWLADRAKEPMPVTPVGTFAQYQHETLSRDGKWLAYWNNNRAEIHHDGRVVRCDVGECPKLRWIRGALLSSANGSVRITSPTGETWVVGAGELCEA